MQGGFSTESMIEMYVGYMDSYYANYTQLYDNIKQMLFNVPGWDKKNHPDSATMDTMLQNIINEQTKDMADAKVVDKIYKSTYLTLNSVYDGAVNALSDPTICDPVTPNSACKLYKDAVDYYTPIKPRIDAQMEYISNFPTALVELKK